MSDVRTINNASTAPVEDKRATGSSMTSSPAPLANSVAAPLIATTTAVAPAEAMGGVSQPPRADDSTAPHADDANEAADAALAHKLHRIFLMLSIPLCLGCGIAAIVLYATHVYSAVTVSVVVAGLFAGSATVLTLFLMYTHLCFYHFPYEQRLILRILLMVPIYAIDSFIALVAYQWATPVNVVRDTYEAYVIYQFFKLLMSYMEGEERTVQLWAEHKPAMRHPPPLCCAPPLSLNERTLTVWKVCLLQYTVLNPILTMITLPLYFTNLYKEGQLENVRNGYVWIAGIRFFSVTFAFTSLVYFFIATNEFMQDKRPLWKFAAIKAIVFVSFWQTVVLAGLNHFGVIPHSQLWDANEVETGLGNFILCIEMYLISLAHRYIFDETPYMRRGARKEVDPSNIVHAAGLSDIFEDTRNLVLGRKNDAARTAEDTEHSPSYVPPAAAAKS